MNYEDIQPITLFISSVPHSPFDICCVQIRLVIEEALNWLPCEDRTVTTPTGKVVRSFYSPKLFLVWCNTILCGY